MSKIRTGRGYRYVKELGGAVRRTQVSAGALWLTSHGMVRGRVLDFGCGFGFDAAHFGWDAFDPYYRQTPVEGPYDTIVCNHVLNMLTRTSRLQAFETMQRLLGEEATAYLIVPRNIPERGKLGLRKRIQNYVRLSLPVIHEEEKLAIYRMNPHVTFSDLTDEIEERMK
ncbi:class I SAM-dependent methyltransferase [Aeoliella sp. ICT_H6.2]|uniref:Class I SAM-dependent methyltransferase n=1 Tax=Aeoliella straminimaris TaxID=2954799 RepID=A0A9X2JJZ4_9BACT|nr:class I SAM-dependent methyltransferase [Aeoliella straminimaris]MCO6045584.1 class I SAM-dependent methyltransferase [Aeoliella straminimaris]